MLHTFKPTPKEVLPRELYTLKKKHGGTAGEIIISGQKLPVLKLENVYLTVDKPPHQLEAIVNMDQMDIHQIRNGADSLHFSQKWRARG